MSKCFSQTGVAHPITLCHSLELLAKAIWSVKRGLAWPDTPFLVGEPLEFHRHLLRPREAHMKLLPDWTYKKFQLKKY